MALYTQEALEEIEYVSGPADSEWGKRRAADGFPEPFPLHYVEIGNEDWFDRSGSYDGRFTQMARAIRERYPHLKIIATAPVKSFKPDLYDDHFYRSAQQLMRRRPSTTRPTPSRPLTFSGRRAGTAASRTAILTFVGEWATQEGRPTPDLNAALADAAFVMGLEKNADAMPMECYAPLLVNVNPADPAKGYPQGLAVEHEPDRLRRPAQLRLAELLRPGDARPEQGRRRASRDADHRARPPRRPDRPANGSARPSARVPAPRRSHRRPICPPAIPSS